MKPHVRNAMLLTTKQWHSDPSHSWLKVHFCELMALGIENKISRYSYRRQNWCFLEEDCDAETYLVAFQSEFGQMPKMTEAPTYDNGHPCRSYPDYHTMPAEAIQ